MALASPPPGWYPDPAGGAGQRWWDGSGWTSRLSFPAPALRPVGALVDEATPARWARAALLVAAAAQFVAIVVMRFEIRDFFDHLGKFGDASTTPTNGWLGRPGNVALQTLGGIETLAAVLFLLWFARSARNARALGLPARREPAAAVAGFIVPIINLWWPYQSTRDLLPDDDLARTIVLRWFLLWVVGGFVALIAGFAAAFIESWVGWAVLALPAALNLLAAIAARQVVSTVVLTHESLSRS